MWNRLYESPTLTFLNVIPIRVSIFGGVGERTREGNDLYIEMQESGVLAESKSCLRSNEWTAGGSYASWVNSPAEYFRDVNDVLLFIDNILRFVQAGSEVSALLGRMPSAVGYQPTLSTEMLQERLKKKDL